MSGLFDIFSNWGMQDPDKRKKSLEDIARGSQYGTGLQNKTESGSPLDPRRYGYTGRIPGRMDANKGVTPNQIQAQNIQRKTGFEGSPETRVATPQDPNFWQRLAGMAGVNPDEAMAHWKDKGGFEGLMANPAFTMGLAFMQAGAEGKTLGQGSLDNVLKAAGISSHYKKIIEDRKQAPIQATAADIDEVKTLLDRVKLKEPNIWEKGIGWIKGDNVTAKYDRAAEAIAIAYQQEIESMKRNYQGKEPLVINEDTKERALKKVLKNKRVKQKDGWAIFGPLTSGTIQMDTTLPQFKARGGPVTRGKAYVVGEE